MPTLLIILAHIPAYVWAILAFILVMGFLQSRDQRMSRPRLLILPLAWLAFGAWGVENAFGLHWLPLLAWAKGVFVGQLLMKRSGWPAGARHDAETDRYFVPGSWLPLALMLAIFTAKFALGMSLAFNPALASQTPAAMGFSAVFGLLSGALLGRSRNILSRRPQAAAGLLAAQA